VSQERAKSARLMLVRHGEGRANVDVLAAVDVVSVECYSSPTDQMFVLMVLLGLLRESLGIASQCLAASLGSTGGRTPHAVAAVSKLEVDCTLRTRQVMATVVDALCLGHDRAMSPLSTGFVRSRAEALRTPSQRFKPVQDPSATLRPRGSGFAVA